MEALEQEKKDLQSQIAQVLEGRQQLASLKMSLSLEVATYRYRLTPAHPEEAEGPQLKGSRAVGGSCSATTRFCDARLIPFTPAYFPAEPTKSPMGSGLGKCPVPKKSPKER